MTYRTIVVDPPWQYQKQPGAQGARTDRYAEGHYPTMTNAEIAALPVRDLAQENAHLYLWTTNPILTRQRWGSPDPIDICLAWGFKPKTILTWIKSGPPGMGAFFRGNTEHIVFAVRGTLPINASQREQNWFTSPRGRHSEKPQAFLDLVERVSPAPYLEMFARQQRFGWDTWGDECFKSVEL